MKFRNIIWCMLALLALASCKEEDDAIVEFANWQETNDSYFSGLVTNTQQKVNDGQDSWSLYPCYTLPDKGYSFGYSDYIVVEKLEQGSGTTSPPADRLCRGTLCRAPTAFPQLSAGICVRPQFPR